MEHSGRDLRGLVALLFSSLGILAGLKLTSRRTREFADGSSPFRDRRRKAVAVGITRANWSFAADSRQGEQTREIGSTGIVVDGETHRSKIVIMPRAFPEKSRSQSADSGRWQIAKRARLIP